MKHIMKVVLALGLIAGSASPAVAVRTGKEVYEAVCIACHGTGLSGATQFGDRKWIELEKKEGVKRLVRDAVRARAPCRPREGAATAPGTRSRPL